VRKAGKAIAVFVIAILGLTAAVVERAEARAPEQQRFYDDCRQRYHGNDRQAQLCYQAQVRAWAHKSVVAKLTDNVAIPLYEATPWLAPPPRGPAGAKGVIYFVRGFRYPGGALDRFRMAPYLLETLADLGWDIIEAKLPQNIENSGISYRLAGGVAATIAKRARDLRAQGYRRVVVGGQSFGAWATLMAERDGVLSADALLLNTPAMFGTRIDPVSGKDNFNFDLNASEFGPLADSIRTPTVLTFFKDDVFDPGGRGDVAEKALTKHGIVHLLVDRPVGFSGHYSGWLPFFDFAFGQCIATFLAAPKSQTCRSPRRPGDDFRAILDLKEVAEADKKRIVSSTPLAGKKFAAYTLDDEDNKHFDYVSANQRVVMESDAEHHETVTFRDGLQCVGATCRALIQWSDHEVLEFDPKSGELKAWWVEDQPR
jgi:hypothetical protein